MSRTPDEFPGERIDESILLLPTGSLPTNPGEIFYASGSVSGSGFFFNEEGNVRALGIDVPTHENLNTLTHDVVLGTTDVSYNCFGISNMVVWKDNTRTQKLQDYNIVYSSKLISAVTSSLYNDANILTEQIVETPVYDTKRRIVSINRTWIV